MPYRENYRGLSVLSSWESSAGSRPDVVECRCIGPYCADMLFGNEERTIAERTMRDHVRNRTIHVTHTAQDMVAHVVGTKVFDGS